MWFSLCIGTSDEATRSNPTATTRPSTERQNTCGGRETTVIVYPSLMVIVPVVYILLPLIIFQIDELFVL